jgi:hypothetical protein
MRITIKFIAACEILARANSSFSAKNPGDRGYPVTAFKNAETGVNQ